VTLLLLWLPLLLLHANDPAPWLLPTAPASALIRKHPVGVAVVAKCLQGCESNPSCTAAGSAGSSCICVLQLQCQATFRWGCDVLWAAARVWCDGVEKRSNNCCGNNGSAYVVHPMTSKKQFFGRGLFLQAESCADADFSRNQN
jgi:hypothetical protein